MSSFFYNGKIFDTPASRVGAYTPHGHLSRVRQPGDRFFNTQIEIVSTDVGIAYGVYGKNDALYDEGVNSQLETVLTDIVAFSDTDEVKSYHLKYGFEYIAAIFVLRRNTSLVFLPLNLNSNTTLSEAAAGALTGISVNKSTKEITISSARAISEVYDYLQWYQSRLANVDIIESEILNTVTGTSYTLKSTWKIIFTAAPSGAWDINADNITLGAVLNLSNFNLSGTLFFDVAGTYTFTDSEIDAVDTVDGDETVVIEIVGSTTIGTNLDPTNISTDLSVLVKVTCLDAETSSPIQNARAYIEAASGGPLSAGTVILNSLTDINGEASTTINFSSNQPIIGKTRKASSSPYYVTSQISGTITSNGFTTTTLMISDE